jgi:heavy metal translocating P-type ATPase
MKKTYKVFTMRCASCVNSIESKLASLENVTSATASLASGVLNVEFEGDDSQIIKTVKSLGFDIYENGKEPKEAKKEYAGLRIIICTVLMIATHLVSHFVKDSYASGWAQLALALTTCLVCGQYFLRGIKGFISFSPNMESLVITGVIASIVYSTFSIFNGNHYYFDGAVMIFTVVSLGKYIESRVKKKAFDSIGEFMKLLPDVAFVEKGSGVYEIPVSDIKEGDIVIVKEGGTVPVDGIIIEGSASFDTSAITGESLPKDLSFGDEVVSSSINLSGYVKIEALSVGGDRIVDKIAALMEEASATKAPIARFADKVSRIFVPAVISVAIITGICHMIFGNPSQAISHAVAVLVVSCPCALGLATPAAVMAAVGKGASKGILIKNAASLEETGRATTVIFDKTGTVTTGKLTVTEAVSVNEGELEKYASSIEANSSHPTATAITNYFSNLKKEKVTGFSTIPGRGVEGFIDNQRIIGGNLKFMKENNVSVPDIVSKGKTILYFAVDGRYIGHISLSDVPREDATECVKTLKEMGIKVVMLSGDNETSVEEIATKTGIEHYQSSLLPADKESFIRQLKENGEKVIMVGDGTNDAPSLISANVGIAVSTGTDISVEAADIVTMSENLSKVSSAVKLGKNALTIIKQNLFWALIYNSLCIPIAAGAIPFIQMSPPFAAIAMSISSICVVANASRLRFKKI